MFGISKPSKTPPTVFHITHHKAGSQWVAEVFKQAAPLRFVHPEENAAHLVNGKISSGMIYPTIYLTKHEFEATLKQNDFTESYQAFYIIRDLRDTLISLFFSLKHSHSLVSDRMKNLRSKLSKMDTESGIIQVMHNSLTREAELQTSWVDSNIMRIRYEDLVENEGRIFRKLRTLAELEISRRQFNRIVKSSSFESISGRKPGEEDLTKHQRKGIAGDWRNYFSDRVKEEFKERYNDVLIKTGYESDSNW